MVSLLRTDANYKVFGTQSSEKGIAPGPREGCEGYIRKNEMLRRGWPLPKRDTDKESYQCRFNYYSIYLIFFNFFIVKQQKSGISFSKVSVWVHVV